MSLYQDERQGGPKKTRISRRDLQEVEMLEPMPNAFGNPKRRVDMPTTIDGQQLMKLIGKDPNAKVTVSYGHRLPSEKRFGPVAKVSAVMAALGIALLSSNLDVRSSTPGESAAILVADDPTATTEYKAPLPTVPNMGNHDHDTSQSVVPTITPSAGAEIDTLGTVQAPFSADSLSAPNVETMPDGRVCVSAERAIGSTVFESAFEVCFVSTGETASPVSVWSGNQGASEKVIADFNNLTTHKPLTFARIQDNLTDTDGQPQTEQLQLAYDQAIKVGAMPSQDISLYLRGSIAPVPLSTKNDIPLEINGQPIILTPSNP